MDSQSIQGHVDDQHRLSAIVPGSVPPGPVTVWIALSGTDEDESGAAWINGIGREWADELDDTRQDLYTLADGEPVDPVS